MHTSHQQTRLHDFDLGCPICGETWLEMTPPNYVGKGYATCTKGHRVSADIWRREQRLRNDKLARKRRCIMPDDGGLKEPVHAFKDTFSGSTIVEDMLRKRLDVPRDDFVRDALLLLTVLRGRQRPSTGRQHELNDWRAAIVRRKQWRKLPNIMTFVLLLEIVEARHILRTQVIEAWHAAAERGAVRLRPLDRGAGKALTGRALEAYDEGIEDLGRRLRGALGISAEQAARAAERAAVDVGLPHTRDWLLTHGRPV